MELNSKILSEIIIYTKYSKFLTDKKRRETWTEIVDRNKAMHLKKYPNMKDEIEWAHTLVYEKKVLPSMRSLQFGGKPIELMANRIYNCCYMPMNDRLAFSELMFLLLGGSGVGYSVQRFHVNKLPPIIRPTKTRRYLIGDSIVGWADSVKVLMKAYFTGNPLPLFDFSDIRPRGAILKTSGGIAPGPEPLKDCLHNIQKILDRKQTGDKLSPLEVHDICCHIADGVLAGGIRRSAMIALFSLEDNEMLECKYNSWYELNPQRGRANNSVVLLRHKINKKTFLNLWEKIQLSGTGEPGFFFTNDKEWGTNPCGEVSLRAHQMCNLVTINVSDVKTQKELEERAKAAAIIATLQAGYTNFNYLREIWKETTEKEALIGVSMTGIASGEVLALNLRKAARVVVKTNAIMAKKIGINKAARCTVIKPEGTSSLVLGVSSGIHAWHAKFYIRRLKVNKNEPIYKYLAATHQELLADDYFKPTTQAIISVPQRSPTSAITREESALHLLNRVIRVYKDWIQVGHRTGHNFNNVSTTISVKPEEWKPVGEWMWKNINNYTALSVFPFDGGNYVQPPYQEIDEQTFNKLTEKLKEVDLTQIKEEEDSTTVAKELACAGSSCEVF